MLEGVGTYVGVWLGLLLLTFATVTASGMNLGVIGLLCALVIAVSKAGLVAYFFMHIRHANSIIKTILFTSLAMLVIIIGFTFFDNPFR